MLQYLLKVSDIFYPNSLICIVKIKLVLKDTCQLKDEMRAVASAFGIRKEESHTQVISLIAPEILVLSMSVCLLARRNFLLGMSVVGNFCGSKR